MTQHFAIEFKGDPWIDEYGSWRAVRLTLHDSVEGDHADLSCWSADDYRTQWLKELNAITSFRDKGALITSLHDPSDGTRVWTWPMWKKGDDVLFHNQILGMLEGCPDFDPDRVCDYIGDYESHTEEGQRISEWTVPLAAIREFVSANR
jgi:hypothetical protein